MSIKYYFSSAEHNWIANTKDPTGRFSNNHLKVVLIRSSAEVAEVIHQMALLGVRHEGGEMVFTFVDDEPIRFQQIFLDIWGGTNYYGISPYNSTDPSQLGLWSEDGQQLFIPLRADVRKDLCVAYQHALIWRCKEEHRRDSGLN